MTYVYVQEMRSIISKAFFRAQSKSNRKFISILLGFQSGYAKYCWFLCTWDSIVRVQHYDLKVWPNILQQLVSNNVQLILPRLPKYPRSAVCKPK